jgi:hypothetical protein
MKMLTDLVPVALHHIHPNARLHMSPLIQKVLVDLVLITTAHFFDDTPLLLAATASLHERVVIAEAVGVGAAALKLSEW